MVKKYKLSVIGLIGSGHLDYSMEIIANRSIFLNIAKRVGLKCSHCRERNGNYVTGWECQLMLRW